MARVVAQPDDERPSLGRGRLTSDYLVLCNSQVSSGKRTEATQLYVSALSLLPLGKSIPELSEKALSPSLGAGPTSSGGDSYKCSGKAKAGLSLKMGAWSHPQQPQLGQLKQAGAGSPADASQCPRLAD